MKKVLASLLVFSFIFAAGALAASQELEKISNPSEIPNFTKIMKKDGSLFGVRVRPMPTNLTDDKRLDDGMRRASGQSEVKNPNLATTTINNGAELEKIASPAELSFFEKIIKKGTALWGIRKSEFRKITFIKPEAAACVKTALDKKDSSLKTGLSTYSQSAINSIDSRNTCQKAAIDKTTAEEQNQALKVCRDAYRQSVRTATTNLKSTQKSAREVFKTDLKACSELQNSTTESPAGNSLQFEDDDNLLEIQ